MRTKSILWESNSFVMETLSFVVINLHGSSTRGCTRSVTFCPALKQDYYVTKTFLLFPEAKVNNRCVLNDNGQKSKQNNKEFW